jgi:uncharacterized protein
MIRRIFVLLAGSIALLAQTAGAQTVDTVPEPRDAAKLALVRELMTVANFRQQLVRTMRASSTLQGAMVPVPPGFWDKFLERAEQDSDTLLAPMAADYARYFTSADLRALVAFYQSPTGQRMSFVAPIISANSSYAGSLWGQKVGREVAAELMKPDASAPAKAPSGKPTSVKKP